MSDKSYLIFNPVILMGPELDKTEIKTTIFDKEGNSVPFVVPSQDEISKKMNEILKLFQGEELRTIAFMADKFYEQMEATVVGVLESAHQLAHHPKSREAGFDEDKLCDGVQNYLTNAAPDPVTPENTHDYVLKNFFHHGQKPN